MNKRAHSLSTLVLLALLAASSVAWAGSVIGTKHPLVAEYTVNAPISGQLRVEFGRTPSYGRSTSSQQVSQNQMAITVVAGMRANTTYHMRARIDGDNQTWYDTDQVFTTGSMPNVPYPHPVVLQPHPFGEGVDLVSDANPNLGFGAVVLDNDGSIIWYYYDPNNKGPALAFPIRQLPNGHFLVQNKDYVREVDLEGNVVRELTLDEVNAALKTAGYDFTAHSFHHDVLRLDNGHLILLVSEVKQFCNLSVPGCVFVQGELDHRRGPEQYCQMGLAGFRSS